MNPYQGRTGPLGLDELEDLTEVLGEKTVRRLILAEKERQKLRKRLEAIADHELKMTKCVLADCGLPIDLNGPMDNLKQKDGYYAHVICPSKDPMHSKDHCAHGVLKRRSCDVCDAVTHEYYAARRKPKTRTNCSYHKGFKEDCGCP